MDIVGPDQNITQVLLITSTLHFRRAAPHCLSCANARTAPDDTNCRCGLSFEALAHLAMFADDVC
jgi:hypothetical protein